MKKDSKNRGVYIRLSVEELEMIQIIKQKHFFNVSAYFRQMIHDLYKKLEKNNE